MFYINFTTAAFFFAYILFIVGIAAILVLAEVHFVKRRKKAEWICPLIAAVLALVLIISNAKVTSHSSGGVGMAYLDGEEEMEIQYVMDGDGRIAGISYLMKGEGENREYLPLTFEDGKLTGGREAMQYRDTVERDLGSKIKGFTGASLPADELNDKQDDFIVETKTFSWQMAAFQCLGFLPGPVLMWIIYLASRLRRSRRNRMEKLKLQDLS